MVWPFNRVKETSTMNIDSSPSMYFGETVVDKLNEQFKGEIENKNVKFPEKLGEEHPFNFKQMEELYKKFGFFTAVVDKYIDFVVGPGFYIECKDARAKKIIEDFMKDVNLDTLLRQWSKEALVKGNGFLEIGGDEGKGVSGLKLLNANYMYVVRDNKGTIEGYNQYIGEFKRFEKKKVIPFKPNEIAHVPFNLIGDCAYGLGIGYTAMKFIDDWLSQNRSLHKLMDRKANAPIHAKFGYIDGSNKMIPKKEDILAFGRSLEIMDNKTEWVTDPLVDFKVIDFGNFGDKFQAILDNDLEMLIYAFQIPAVLLGKANVPEGLAKVQMEAFQRRIQSIQAELEKIIEQKIFKRVLEVNGLGNVDVEFEWGTPSVMETEGRLKVITDLMKSSTVSRAMSMTLEDELINILKLNKDEWEKVKLEQEKQEEEERKRLETQAQPIVPGQNKNFPQKVAPKKEQPKQPKAQEMQKVGLDISVNKDEQTKEILDSIKTINTKLETKKKKKRAKRITNSLLPKSGVKKSTKKKEKMIVKFKRTEEKKNYEHKKDCAHCEESFGEVSDIQEWLGFNYKKYLAHIANALSAYDFAQIKAVNEIELEAGYLTGTQVESLREVLDTGFKKGQGMKDMAKQVDKKVELKDLYRMTEDGTIKLGASGLPILSRSADKRAIAIVRSEVTRMANAGAVEFYKVNEIKQVSWISSFGKRTCPTCEGLNGQIFEINNHPDIPQHPMCRCTLSPVVDLK